MWITISDGMPTAGKNVKLILRSGKCVYAKTELVGSSIVFKNTNEKDSIIDKRDILYWEEPKDNAKYRRPCRRCGGRL